MRGFVAKVWDVNQEIKFDHCLIHHEAVFAEALPRVLENDLDEIIKNVNFIKS